MKKKIIPKVIINVLMFGFFVLAAHTFYLVDKTGMSTSIIFNIAVGIVSLLGLSVLCLVHTMDTTPDDVSSHLFLGMIAMAYFGIISDNIAWVVDYSNQHIQHLIIYALEIGGFLVMPLMLLLFWNYQNRVFIGESEVSNKIKKVVNSLAVVDIVYVIIGSATHYIFYIDANGTYNTGDGILFTFKDFNNTKYN